MPTRTQLLKMRIVNLGCIGSEGLDVSMDKMLCLVGPNNTGKSTVLRAYELIMGTATFGPGDRCQRSGEAPTTVELWIHIPDGIPNVAARWKKDEGEYKVVQSIWIWNKDDPKPVRKTWDPAAGSYSEDELASGLDDVFKSRLPRPLRIGALDNPEEEHKNLLTIVLQPVADKLKAQLTDQASSLSQAYKTFEDAAKAPVQEQDQEIDRIEEEISRSHKEIFPSLSIDIDIDLGKIPFDPLALLRQNSGIRFTDFGDRTLLSQQGTGSQRAVFWAMLQVRSRLKTAIDRKAAKEKERSTLQKSIPKLEKDFADAKKPETQAQRKETLDKAKARLAELEAPEAETDVDLPGFMLLIDEPEIALHPSAIRAASKYLYGLAKDPTWQVMMTTHSPVFVNPLEDHTTIVRLQRDSQTLTPRTYRSDDISFSPDEKENLKMLNMFDTGMAEMFFGQYPILVEGDTEYTAFEAVANKRNSEYPQASRPVIVRAHGKDTLGLLCRMLVHFRIPFSILHDSDSPTRIDGNQSSAWSANERIHEAIVAARGSGLKAIHRIAIPNFATTVVPGEAEPEEDKPWNIWQKLDSADVEDQIDNALKSLMPTDSNAEKPFEYDDFMSKLRERYDERGR